MESLFVPTLIVALAEIGDKTQLLALLLAARFRKPWPIIAGIVAATLANHFAAGAVGAWVASFFSEATLSWILAASFIAVALWTLVPDKLDDEESGLKKYGPFLTTLIAFFLAEMGDKTQVATVMLAAQYPHFWLVVIGTPLGMLIANVPGRRQAAADPDPPPGRGRLRRTWPVRRLARRAIDRLALKDCAAGPGMAGRPMQNA